MKRFLILLAVLSVIGCNDMPAPTGTESYMVSSPLASQATVLRNQYAPDAPITFNGEQGAWQFESPVPINVPLLMYAGACNTMQDPKDNSQGITECDSASEAQTERQALIDNGYTVSILYYSGNMNQWYFFWDEPEFPDEN